LPGAAAGQEAELTFVDPDELAFALPSDDFKTVWLRSDSVAGPVEWRLLVDKGGASEATLREATTTRRGAALEVEGDEEIGVDSVERYAVHIRGLSTDDVEGAQLVARVPGAAPASIEASISAKSDFEPTLNVVLLAPLGIALVLLFFRGLSVNGGFGGTVGSVDLDFSKSFATTLTAVGALLGTILSEDLLDDSTAGVSKEGFQALNLTFGVLILVAPLVYLLFQRQKTTTKQVNGKTEEETHYEGKTWALLVSSAITLWAVIGEIATIYLLLGQLDAAGSIGSTAITIMQGALFIGALCALFYSWRKLRWIVETASGGAAPALVGGFLPAEAVPQPAQAPPSWSPL
jgi:hypothetical protein